MVVGIPGVRGPTVARLANMLLRGGMCMTLSLPTGLVGYHGYGVPVLVVDFLWPTCILATITSPGRVWMAITMEPHSLVAGASSRRSSDPCTSNCSRLLRQSQL